MVRIVQPSASTGSLLIQGDALHALTTLPDTCVQTVVASPPYWGLRDYTAEGQIGLEDDLDDYIARLVAVFTQVHRVLRPDGTVWLNLGDCYTSGNRRTRAVDKRNPARAMAMRPPTPPGLKPKDLVGVPWRVAFALQDTGWFLRSEVVWRKPNAQPESVRDRPSVEHETIFLLSKAVRYRYDPTAVTNLSGSRLRTVWDISTRPLPATIGHAATFPEALAERCIRLTSQPGDLVLDPFLGSGTTALVAHRLGRRFAGVEINPVYIDICRRRLDGADFQEATR